MAEGVFCVEHAPKAGEKPKGAEKKKGSKALKQLFMMVLFLTAGLALLIFVGNYLLQSILGGMADSSGVAQALRSSGWMIVYGMGGLTILLGLMWAISRRS